MQAKTIINAFIQAIHTANIEIAQRMDYGTIATAANHRDRQIRVLHWALVKLEDRGYEFNNFEEAMLIEGLKAGMMDAYIYGR